MANARYPFDHHLTLTQRKTFRARLLILNATAAAARLPIALDPDADSILMELTNEGLNFANAAIRSTTDQDDIPLDQYVARIASQVEDHFSPKNYPLTTATQVLAISSVIELMRQALAPFSCAACTMHQATCCGIPNDDKLVHDRGLCIATIKDAFNFAVAIATEVFDSCPSARRPLPLGVQLATKHEPGTRSHLPTADLFISAHTTPAAPCVSTVTVRVSTARVSQTCLNALRYILTHECLAHAYLVVHSPDRVTAHAGDAFMEGWMDYVAKLAHDRATPDDSPDKAASTRLHDLRGDLDSQPRMPGAPAVRIGRGAAVRVLKGLREIAGDPSAGVHLFERLSTGLATSHLTREDLNDLAAAVWKTLDPIESATRQRLTDALSAGLASFATGGLITSFAKPLLNELSQVAQ